MVFTMETIQISYGPHYSTSDISINESITSEVINKELQLHINVGSVLSNLVKKIKK